jgi:sigma-B regulation protein RsbU (phosphoserine phosphatase)
MAAEKLEHPAPGSLLMDLNNVLKSRMERGMNVTMVIGLINAQTKTLTLANAGNHAHPLLVRGGEVTPIVTKGMPLGMMAGVRYREVEIPLQSGDIIIFMTDGIIEAQNREGVFYSNSGRLNETISQVIVMSDTSASAIVEAIINNTIAFGSEKSERDDDMTVVVTKIV